jgi:hypothetical protein
MIVGVDECVMVKVIATLVTPDPADFATAGVPALELDLGGIPGDRHYGMTARADSRYPMYPRGTEIRNRRQLSAVSVEEMAVVAQALGVPEVKAEWLGANLLLEGLPDLTLLPAGARLLFPSGAGLICEGENEPCLGPGEKVQEQYPDVPRLAPAFVKAAVNRRGIVLSVERAGVIRPGDVAKIEM